MASKKNRKQKGRWNGHKFKVSANLIRGFDSLQIKGSSATEEKKKNGQIYIARKNGRPAEVSITVHLNAFTGCEVRKEAMKFVSEAQKGKKDYFYVGNKKLTPYKLLLTDATVKEIQIAPDHTWVSADVQLTFKQTGTGGKSVSGSTGNGSSGGGSSGGSSGGSYGGGSAKQSVRTSPATTTASLWTKERVDAVKSAGITLAKGAATIASSLLKPKVNSAVNNISKIQKNAKSYSASQKAGGGGSRYYYASR